MWLAGTMGLAVGLGFWQIAVVLTLAALIVLSLLHILHQRILPPEPEDKAEVGSRDLD
jgi:uncharacterized membrane protein YhiD involved in acid resistance